MRWLLAALVLLGALWLASAAEPVDPAKLKQAQEKWDAMPQSERDRVLAEATKRAEEKAHKLAEEQEKARREAEAAAAKQAARQQRAKEKAEKKRKQAEEEEAAARRRQYEAEQQRTKASEANIHPLYRAESRTAERAAVFWTMVMVLSFVCTRVSIWCCVPRAGKVKVN